MKTYLADTLNVIPLGSVNAAPAKGIADLLDIDERDLRSRVRELRLKGYPVVSNQEGYYIADLNEEGDMMGLRGSIRTLKSHAESERKIAEALEKTLRKGVST